MSYFRFNKFLNLAILGAALAGFGNGCAKTERHPYLEKLPDGKVYINYEWLTNFCFESREDIIKNKILQVEDPRSFYFFRKRNYNLNRGIKAYWHSVEKQFLLFGNLDDISLSLNPKDSEPGGIIIPAKSKGNWIAKIILDNEWKELKVTSAKDDITSKLKFRKIFDDIYLAETKFNRTLKVECKRGGEGEIGSIFLEEGKIKKYHWK